MKSFLVFYLVLLVVSVLSTAFIYIHVVPYSLPVCRSSSLQEKGKVTFEEFSLDAERRAHGMRCMVFCNVQTSYKTCLVLLGNLALLLANVLGKHEFAFEF